mgnify:CR=1 FL=1|jgi:hypothetical protein
MDAEIDDDTRELLESLVTFDRFPIAGKLLTTLPIGVTKIAIKRGLVGVAQVGIGRYAVPTEAGFAAIGRKYLDFSRR